MYGIYHGPKYSKKTIFWMYLYSVRRLNYYVSVDSSFPVSMPRLDRKQRIEITHCSLHKVKRAVFNFPTSFFDQDEEWKQGARCLKR